MFYVIYVIGVHSNQNLFLYKSKNLENVRLLLLLRLLIILLFLLLLLDMWGNLTPVRANKSDSVTCNQYYDYYTPSPSFPAL